MAGFMLWSVSKCYIEKPLTAKKKIKKTSPISYLMFFLRNRMSFHNYERQIILIGARYIFWVSNNTIHLFYS